MIEQYHRHLNPWMYEGKKWSVLLPPGAIETDLSYEFPGYYDYHARGSVFYAVISSVKNYGSATFYLDIAETADGEWLDGSKNYKLVVPPNVPVNDFWAVTVYDLESASYIREMSKSSIDSSLAGLKKNKDDSVNVYFAPATEVSSRVISSSFATPVAIALSTSISPPQLLRKKIIMNSSETFNLFKIIILS